MKLYGNSKGDGFALLCAVVSGVFLLGGLGLSTVGGVTLLVAVPAFVLLCVVLLRSIKRWDVMSEADALVGASGADAASFEMAHHSDAEVQPLKAAWAPSADHISNLPARLDPPKSAVETNTPVV